MVSRGNQGENPHLSPYTQAWAGINPQLAKDAHAFMMKHRALEPFFPLLFGRTSLYFPSKEIYQPSEMEKLKKEACPSGKCLPKQPAKVEGTTDIFLINISLDSYRVHLSLQFNKNHSCTAILRSGHDDGHGKIGRGVDDEFFNQAVRKPDSRFELLSKKYPNVKRGGVNGREITILSVELDSDESVKSFLLFFSEHMN